VTTYVRIDGQRALVRQCRALAGPKLRAMARRVAKAAMKPVLSKAKSLAPIHSGRLRASLGELAKSKKSYTKASVGTRRDFVYRNRVTKQKTVTGSGKVRDRALQKGAVQDRTTAQQYASLIEFGKDKKGRMRRRAGPARFLETAITTLKPQIIQTVSTEVRRYLATP
jgi:HK97 gp10 family phage protein